VKRFVTALLVSVSLATPCMVAAQNQAGVPAVKALAAEWTRAVNAHDASAVVALYDEKPIGLFVFGGTAYARDSLKGFHERTWAARSNEAWTVDRADVVMLSDQTALMTVTWSGRYTTNAGVTWEFKSNAIATAIVQRRGTAWKIVAMQNAASGTQVRK
jgi:uncharacterized protein (TIGR02246 family)